MNHSTKQRLLNFLRTNFDTDGSIHFLVASTKKIENPLTTELFKLRVAVTFQHGTSLIPYFDGTELYIEIGPSNIQFAREDEWADGPPIMEGSPNELALPWVSELAEPFFVSPEAQAAANKPKTNMSGVNADFDLDKFL